jgi:hypothetical protein
MSKSPRAGATGRKLARYCPMAPMLTRWFAWIKSGGRYSGLGRSFSSIDVPHSS